MPDGTSSAAAVRRGQSESLNDKSTQSVQCICLSSLVFHAPVTMLTAVTGRCSSHDAGEPSREPRELLSTRQILVFFLFLFSFNLPSLSTVLFVELSSHDHRFSFHFLSVNFWSGTDLIILISLLILLLFAPSFQFGSGWNLAGTFFT